MKINEKSIFSNIFSINFGIFSCISPAPTSRARVSVQVTHITSGQPLGSFRKAIRAECPREQSTCHRGREQATVDLLDLVQNRENAGFWPKLLKHQWKSLKNKGFQYFSIFLIYFTRTWFTSTCVHAAHIASGRPLGIVPKTYQSRMCPRAVYMSLWTRARDRRRAGFGGKCKNIEKHWKYRKT